MLTEPVGAEGGTVGLEVGAVRANQLDLEGTQIMKPENQVRSESGERPGVSGGDRYE